MLGCNECLNYPICDDADKGTRCEAFELRMIKECCICGNEFEGWGNNPWPVKREGECCDSCNNLYVVPARIEAMYKTEV